MNRKITNFRDLDAWQKGIEIVKGVYTTVEGFPRQEVFGLTSQMRRSAVSIPSNIAEGFNRFHNRGYKQFLYVAGFMCRAGDADRNRCGVEILGPGGQGRVAGEARS